MADYRVKFLILGSDADNAQRTESDPVTVRMQLENEPEPNPRVYTFPNRAEMERAFEIAGLAPCLLNPAELEGFWDVSDGQLRALTTASGEVETRES